MEASDEKAALAKLMIETEQVSMASSYDYPLLLKEGLPVEKRGSL